MFVVAIDGPAAAGKGTISKAVANYFGFVHLDTGLLYRAIGVLVLEGRDPVEAAQNLSFNTLERSDLRSAAAAKAASKNATNPNVRQALVEFQRNFAASPKGAVLDGRDIGTVICPNADVKLFITASSEVRAKRRFKELVASGSDTTFDQVFADVLERDERDATRKDAPTRAADDAQIIDTSDLSIDQAVDIAKTAIKARRNG